MTRYARRSSRAILAVRSGVLLAVATASLFTASVSAAQQTAFIPGPRGELDCNGHSTIQSTIKLTGACADVHGFKDVYNANTWDGRFYDNGHYIGHDEPDLTFLSNRPGSGNDVTWTETLPRDPVAGPTVATPGSDVTHWFELSSAPWFSMALCNSQSNPFNPCTPNSDANAPRAGFLGGGSSFLEVQFYPPGMAPFLDNLSCDNEHWCSSLHINDLECTGFFANCNPGCVEPTNFAFIQRDGIPTGPPSPQEATFASFTPNAQTLLMNPGDTIRVHIFDARAPGGGHALEVAVKDLSSGQSGLMQASAANRFAATSLNDCSGTAFNYEPEYSSAAQSNVTPWGPDRTDISAEFEIGHFTPCSALSDPATDGLLGFTAGDPFWLTCNGPYESSADNGAGNPEGFGGDAFCFPAGDTHTALNAFGISADPNEATGCLDILSTTARGGDVDYDGTSYWPDWPTGASPTATTPGSFLISAPTSDDHPYSQSIFQTDAALSEAACTPDSLANCTIPPPGPGNFYPYWSTVRHGDTCTIEFGNVASGPGVNNYGGAAQYGADRVAALGFPEFESKPIANVC